MFFHHAHTRRKEQYEGYPVVLSHNVLAGGSTNNWGDGFPVRSVSLTGGRFNIALLPIVAAKESIDMPKAGMQIA